LAEYIIVPARRDLTAETADHAEVRKLNVRIPWATLNNPSVDLNGCQITAAKSAIRTDHIDEFVGQERVITVDFLDLSERCGWCDLRIRSVLGEAEVKICLNFVVDLIATQEARIVAG